MNRTLPLLALATAGLITLSACGSSGGDTASSGQQTQQGYAAGNPDAGGQGGGMPGAFGKIAAKSGKTLQVQGSDSQVAVTYTAKTSITQQVTGSIKDVKVGTCVTVMPAEGSSGSASAGGSAAGSGSASTSAPVTAGTIRIAAAVNGSCDSGRGFGGQRGGGGRPSGAPSGMPSGMPSDFPSGGASGAPRGGRMFGTSGKVTAVTADGFTVAARAPGSKATAKVSVEVGSTTTVTTTRSASASALKVGKCVSATGKSDDTGAVSASRISLSDPVDGECTGGFMRRAGSGS